MKVIVRDVVFYSPESSWTVFRGEDVETNDIHTCVGNFLNIESAKGCELHLTGDWVTDTKYGKQFQFSVAFMKKPSSLDGYVQYLANSDLFPNVGPVRARKMVDTFGELIEHVIVNETERLTEIPGINEERANEIRDRYVLSSKNMDLFVELVELGLTMNQIYRLSNVFEVEDILPKIRENPYHILYSFLGLPFKEVDIMAQNTFGIDPDSPVRIEYVIYYAISDALNRTGHTYVNWSTFFSDGLQRNGFVFINLTFIVDQVKEMILSGKLGGVIYDDGHFIFSLKDVWDNETFIYDWLYRRVGDGFDSTNG